MGKLILHVICTILKHHSKKIVNLKIFLHGATWSMRRFLHFFHWNIIITHFSSCITMKNTIQPLMYWITTTRTTLALTTLQQSFFFTDPVTIQYLASTSSILQLTLHSPVNGIHLFVRHGNLQLFF